MAGNKSAGSLSGKVILITGGSKGIGKAVCYALAEEGCKIAIADIDLNGGNSVMKELNDQYGKCSTFISCDVSCFSQFQKAFEKTIETHGRVDIVINNAGILNEHKCKETVEVNLLGTINGTLLGLQFMGKDRGGSGGSIINISSNAALAPFPLAPVYSATKHGILGLTLSYGHPLHFERTSVSISSLCPCAVNTDLNANFCENSAAPDAARTHMANTVMMEPTTVAQALVKLLRDGRSGSIMEVSVDGVRYLK